MVCADVQLFPEPLIVFINIVKLWTNYILQFITGCEGMGGYEGDRSLLQRLGSEDASSKCLRGDRNVAWVKINASVSEHVWKD